MGFKVKVLFFLAVAAIVLMNNASGHVRFVCPRPQSTNSGIKSGPCGDSNFETGYMDVVPGPLTLKFEETIFHKGAPSSVRLLKKSDKSKYCMLLDHIPHNEAADVKFPFTDKNCKINGEPVGLCTGYTYVTVKIPDIECDDCYLQLISVMTDKYDSSKFTCVQFNSSYNNCSTYYACANIKIRPTPAGKGKGIDTCLNYLGNLLGVWPYMLTPNEYGDEPLDFTKQGWLTGPSFLGTNATYSGGLESAGECGPDKTVYGVYMMSPTSALGALSMTVIDNRMHVSGIVSGLTGDITGLVMESSTQTAAIPLSIKTMNKTASLQGVFDIKQWLSFGFKKLKIKTTASQNGEVSGDIKQDTLQASLFHQSGSYHGEGILSFEENSDKGGYNIVVDLTVINIPGLSSSNKDSVQVSLSGPVRRDMAGPTLVSMSGTSKYSDQQGGANAWSGQMRTEVTPDILMYLWREEIQAVVTFGGTTLRGQISRPNAGLCSNQGYKVLCQMSKISTAGGNVDRTHKTVQTNGLVTFTKKNDTLSYMVTLKEMKKAEQVTEISLMNGDTLLSTKKGILTQSNVHDFVQQSAILSQRLTSKQMNDLANGKLKISVKTNVTSGSLYGSVPSFGSVPTPQPARSGVPKSVQTTLQKVVFLGLVTLMTEHYEYLRYL